MSERTIELNRGLHAIVDEADFDRVNPYTWTVAKRGRTHYATTTRKVDGRQVTCYLHAFITGFAMTDHINGDGLDNRRSNLRETTPTQNMCNVAKRKGCTSQFKGVWKPANSSRWSAAVKAGGKRQWLGTYATEVEAAQAYDRAARGLHGQFAALNFPINGEQHALRPSTAGPDTTAPLAPAKRRMKRCVNGHDYDEKNVLTGNPKAKCRTCSNAQMRRWRAKQRAKAQQ